MPTPTPPASPESELGKNAERPLPARSQAYPDLKTGKLFPTMVYDAGGSVPSILQIIVPGELNGLLIDNIILMARVNQRAGLRIHLWHDSAIFSGKALYDYFQARRFIPQYNYEYVEATVKRLSFYASQAERAISKSLGGDEELAQRIKEYLANQPGLQERLAQLEHEENQQLDTLERLKQQLVSEGFDVHDYDLRNLPDSAIQPTDRWFEQYHNEAYLKFNENETRRLLWQHAAITEGGAVIDPRRQPKLNESILSHIPQELLDSVTDTELLRLAINELILNRINETSGSNWGENRAAQIASIRETEGANYQGNFAARLSEQFPALVTQLRQALVPDRSITDYFNPLDLTVDNVAGVKLGLANELAHVSPEMIITKPGAPALVECASTYIALKDLEEGYGNHRKQLVQGVQGESPDKVGVRLSGLRERYTNSETGIITIFLNRKYGSTFTRQNPGLANRLYSIFSDNYEAIVRTSVDPQGLELGIPALKRSVQKVIWVDQSQTIPDFDESRFGTKAYTSLTEAVFHYREPSFYRTTELVRVTRYDNQVFLNIGDEAELLSGSDLLSQKNQLTSVENSQLKTSRVRWGNSDGSALIRESGQFRKLGRNSRLDVVGHGSLMEQSIGNKSPEEIVDFIVNHLVGENRHFRTLAIKACRVICEWNDKFIDRLFKAFERHGVQVDQITAPSRSVFIGIGERTWALIGSKKSPDAVVENKPVGTRFLGTYQDGVTHLRPRSGVVPDDAALRKTYSEISAYAALSSSESRESPLLSIAASLLPSEISITSPDLQTRLNHLGSDLIRGRGILPADITPLLLAMNEAREIGRLTVTDLSTLKVAGVQAAVELAGNSANPTEWLAKLSDFPEAKQALTTWLEQQPDSLVAFRRLQERANNNGFAFYTADPTSEDGAAFINHDNVDPFAVVLVDSLPSCGGGGGRARRQACSNEEIEEDAREKVSALTLESDDNTRILVGSSNDDIALHSSGSDPVLAKVQEGIYNFRRSTTSQHIADHEGYHNIIALDSDSFSAAQTLARNSNEEGRALLFNREKGVLLTEDGRVVTMVEGGAHNRVSVVGNTESFSAYAPHELAGGVRSLVRGEKVASVTVHPVLEEGEGFHLQGSFEELEISDRNSPWRDVADYVRLHALEKKSGVRGGVVETGNMQVGVPGKSDTFLFDGDYIRDALNLGRAKQPGVLEAQLRAKMAELHEQGRTAEREVFQSLTLDYANKVRDLRARFEVFKEAMKGVYEKTHTDEKTSTEFTLSADEDIPLLSTLHEVEENGAKVWKMQFSDHDINKHSLKLVTIEDDRIIHFVHDYNDKIEKVRSMLKLNHPEEGGANLRGRIPEQPEFVDGVSLAFAMQTVLDLAGKDKDELLLRNQGIKNPDYRRALLVHQAVGMAFGAKVVLGTVLDVGKYFAALSDGKIVTLPERFASRISSVAEKIGGPLGKGLSVTAKVAKVSGQIFDGALILVSIGLDITEIAKADTEAGKALAGLQLGLDTGLGLVTGASILVSAIGSFGVATATLATVSGVLGAITVPLAGLAVGIMGLAQNYVVLEAEMDATALLFDAVQKSATLHNAFNQSTNIINLAGGLAPIKEIDFHQKTIKYGQINLPRVTGGAGRGTGYWLSGPDIRHHDYFNILDKKYVKKHLLEDLSFPSERPDAIVLPNTPNWKVTSPRNWNKATVPGATTWHLRHKGESGGWWMLERAEIKDSHGKDFAFTYMFMIFPPFIMWEEAMVLSTSDVEKEEDFLKKNLEFGSASSLWVKFTAPDYNVTVVAPSEVNYQVYGTGHNTFTLLFAERDGGGKVHLYPDADDRWVVGINGTEPLGQVHATFDSHHNNATTLTVGGHQLWMHGFTKNLTIVDQQDRLYIYLIDPDNPTRATNRVTLTPSNLMLTDEEDRETLQDEYKHPGGSLNPVQRFQKLEDCNWLDLDPGESGGVDMMIPIYFDGVIQKDQVLPAGLYGEFYRTTFIQQSYSQSGRSPQPDR